MIIVNLSGGLGNQMFQYAAGRSLASRLNTSLKLNLSFFKQQFNPSKVTPRSYELFYFNIRASLLKSLESKLVHYLAKNNLFIKKYQESSLDYDQKFVQKTGDILMNGYWQSEKYFHSIASAIKNDFCFRYTLNKQASIELDKIKKCNSVSVHIRRGDYVSNPTARQTHGLCSVHYYDQAIKFIAAKTAKIHLFIFSDDIAWCKQNLHYVFPTTYISNNKNWEDLQLMSACKYNIIANSSFSWWGAWLNENKNKIVIAPSKWFIDIKINPSDRYPQEWILI